jgi:hypothetical protein
VSLADPFLCAETEENQTYGNEDYDEEENF